MYTFRAAIKRDRNTIFTVVYTVRDEQDGNMNKK